MAINSLNSTSHGLSGLASGMDTQSMVNAMLAGTQAKIDKSTQNKARLTNKQSIYRDVISQFKTFQETYFQFRSGSTSNLLSNGFYNNMKASASSKYFNATATNNANAGKTSINSINQLAQSLKYKARNDASGEVTGKLDLSKNEGGDLIILLDGVQKTIKMPVVPDNFVGDAAAKDAEFARLLQDSITKSLGSGINVSIAKDNPDGVPDGNILFTATDSSRQFQIMGVPAVMDVLGMRTGSTNKIDTRQAIENINFATPNAGTAFQFQINGVDFSFTDQDSLSSVISKINTSNANVKVTYSTLEDRFSIESTVSGKGTKIEMSQSEGNLLTSMFGIKGTSGITGESMTEQFTITGKLPGMEPVPTDPDKLKFALDSINSQVDRTAKMGKFVLYVDGKEVEVKLPERAEGDVTPYTMDELATAVNDNQQLKDAGVTLAIDKATGDVTLTAKPGVKLEVGAGFSTIGLTSGTKNQKAATGTTTLDAAGLELTTVMVGGRPVIFNGSMTMQEAAEKLQAALVAEGATNAKVEFDGEQSKGRFRIFGVDIPMEVTVSGDGGKMFGQDKIVFEQGDPAGLEAKIAVGDPGYDAANPDKTLSEKVTEGQNAILFINNERVERNSNEFTIEGMNYALKGTFNNNPAETDPENMKPKDPIVTEDINVTRDTDQIYNGITKFMEDYNKMIDNVWGLLKEKTTYKDYPALTDEQKASMSDKEVELWEQKSREGLLRSDSLLNGIMEAMRSTLTQKAPGAKYSLAEVGITAGFDFEKLYGGKLEFTDVDGSGDKLRSIIAQEPEELEKLFSDSTNGIMVQMNKIMESVTTDTRNKVNDPYAHLSIVNMAGKPGLPDTFSTIYNELKDVNSNLENLKRKYELEYNRYWKQFNTMEQTIQSMNQQSSWLTQQFQS